MTREDGPAPVAPAVPTARPYIGDFQRQIYAHLTILKFTLVGILGYLIYQALLFLMYDSPLFPFLPRKGTSADLLLFRHDDVRLLITTIVAAESSIVGVFLGHSLWTFSDWPTAGKPAWLRFLQFQAKALVSTLGILTVTVNILTVEAGLAHYVSLPIGIVAAFTWNWLWDSRFVWRRRPLS